MKGNTPASGGRKRPRRRGGRSGGRKEAPSVTPLEPIETPPDVESFREWELDQGVLDAIESLGITKPTPIQALSIGPALEGRDVIAKAETGTGKTLAFGAPMMSRISPRRASVLALVLSPTRELAEQVYKVLETLGDKRGLKCSFVVGGEPMAPQIHSLRDGAQVVVGTPGRVLDLLRQRFLAFPWTEFVVLDEADKMLEIGFLEDVRSILKAVAPEAQKLLFSATFPPDLLTLARGHTQNPVEVATASGFSTVDTISQYFARVDEDEGFRFLSRVIEKSGDEDAFIVFCHRRTDVNRLFRRMERKRYSVKALHGGYEQDARFSVMEAFRNKDVKALIATDIASRGLDVKHVTHVVNFGVPRDASDYTHRIGRTGRAGREGTAITFVFPPERRNWSSIERGVGWSVQELFAPGDLEKAQRGEEITPAKGGKEDGGSRRSGESSGEGRGRERRGDGERRRSGDRRGGGDRRRRQGDRRRDGEDRGDEARSGGGDSAPSSEAARAEAESARESAAKSSGESTSGERTSDERSGDGEPKRRRRRRRRSRGGKKPGGDATSAGGEDRSQKAPPDHPAE